MLKGNTQRIKIQSGSINIDYIAFSIVVLLLALLFLSSGCTSDKKEAATKATPKLNEMIFYKYGDSGLKKVSRDGLVNTVNLSAKKGNDALEVKEVYYDKTRVSISLVAGNGELIAKEFDYKFYYNGKEFAAPVNWNRFLRVIDGRQYDIFSLDTFSSLPANFDLKVVATKLGITKEVLSVNVPVDRAQADALTKGTLIMKDFTAAPRSVTVRSILMAPSATMVSYFYSGLSNDTLNSPDLLDQNGKKMDYVGKGGSLTIKNNKGSSLEYFDIYGPVSNSAGEFKMNFVFVDENKTNISIPVSFIVP
jgi:hypothetical protein